jgi:hypothetical protein
MEWIPALPLSAEDFAPSVRIAAEQGDGLALPLLGRLDVHRVIHPDELEPGLRRIVTINAISANQR